MSINIEGKGPTCTIYKENLKDTYEYKQGYNDGVMETCNEILKYGHGGGNFRQIALTLPDRLKLKTTH